MARRSRAPRLAPVLALALLLVALPPLGPAAASPAPLSTVVPFALPLLEGPQAKVEIGANAPNGNATSYWGNQPAYVNFSVWWWDSGAPTTSRLVLDGVPYSMAAAPGGDGDDSNGTLFVVKVNDSALAAGDHEWYFDFTGPSGPARLPSAGNFTNLRLDTADRFLSDSLRNTANQIINARRAGAITTLRDVVNRTVFSLDSTMATDWNPTDGYNYTDPNHHIIQPGGATADGREAFVVSSGASRARYTDAATFINNSQPASKQALVLKGVLLATTYFNESDIEIRTETMVVNVTSYPHPYLRVALNDGSEAPGDGPVDGDNLMDADLWGFGLPSPVAVGSHFGEDFDALNDLMWDGSIGWPPAADPYSSFVLAPYKATFNVSAPDGSTIDFYLYDSKPNAGVTTPRLYNTYWTDEPVVFDGLSSNQTAFIDLAYDWVVENTVWVGFGPIWLQPIIAVGTYTATLSVRDPFGQVDSTTVTFSMHGKTKLRNPVSEIQFPEDGRDVMDLRAFFTDDDGFSTIQFEFSTSPSDKLSVERWPPSGPTINFTAAPNWCGLGSGTINATDGQSPLVVAPFIINVTCLNDPPELAGLPTAVNFSEDGLYALNALSTYATDIDGDALVWSFGGTAQVTGTYYPANDTLVLQAPPNWSGVDSGVISVTDGAATVTQSLTITVIRANDAPYQDQMIPAYTVGEDSANTTFVLSDYFTDPDGDPLAASVAAGTGLEAGYFPVLLQVWFHPMANFSGATSLTLRVRDGSGAEVTVTVDVVVVAVNDPPLIVSVDPSLYASAAEGDKLTFLVMAVDSDSPTLTYAFDLDGEPQGASFLGSFDWQTGYLSAGRHTLNVTVTDGAGGETVYHWSILVSDRNRGPTVTISQAGAAQYNTGDLIHLAADGADPDGDNLTYTWSFGGALQPMSGPAIDLRINSEGNYTVKVTVSDGKLSASDTIVVKVVYVPPVEPPSNHTTPPTTTGPGFLPGIEGAAVLVTVGAAAALFMALSRRRR